MNSQYSLGITERDTIGGNGESPKSRALCAGVHWQSGWEWADPAWR